MKEIISKKDLQQANNAKRANLLKKIAEGRAVYKENEESDDCESNCKRDAKRRTKNNK